jgi:C-terminal processing protease CtpA/Prc
VLVIADVIPGSPAAVAGILVGDTVVAARGVATESLDSHAVERDVLKPDPGRSIVQVVRRNGVRNEHTFVARVLQP